MIALSPHSKKESMLLDWDLLAGDHLTTVIVTELKCLPCYFILQDASSRRWVHWFLNNAQLVLKGSRVTQENFLHTIIPAAAWSTFTRQDGSMDSLWPYLPNVIAQVETRSSGQSILPENNHTLDFFLFCSPFAINLEMTVWENHRRSAVSEILKPIWSGVSNVVACECILYGQFHLHIQ